MVRFLKHAAFLWSLRSLIASMYILECVDGINEHSGSGVDDDPMCNSVTKHVSASDISEDCDFISCASISQSYWSVSAKVASYFYLTVWCPVCFSYFDIILDLVS